MRAEKKFSYEEFKWIDGLLSAIEYKGIPITGVPGNFLKDNFITTPYYHSTKKMLLNGISRFRLRHFQKFKTITEEVYSKKTDYLFPLCSTSQRFAGFASPVIDKLGKDRCLICAPEKTADNIIQDGMSYFSFPNITSGIYARWKREYKYISSRVKNTITQIRKEKNISLTAAIDLEANIMYQTIMYENALEVLNDIKPRAIISDLDRMNNTCALVMAGNYLGIPTFTFIAGAIDPPDCYIPVIAKYIFCWGNDHLETLLDVNTPIEKLIITGNTKLSRKLEADSSQIMKKLNIQLDERKNIVLFSNNIESKFQLELAESFITFCQNNHKVKGIIKLHPMESPDNYSTLNLPENVSLYPASMLSLEEALAIADGVLAHNSLATVDTLIKKKPLAILNTIPLPLGIAERLHINADVPLIVNQKTFDAFIKSLFENEYSFELKEKFVNNFCAAFGNEAVEKTIEAIFTKK